MIGRLADLEPDDVVLEVGPGPRHPDPLPRRAGRARARRRARPLARAEPARGARARPSTGSTRSRSTRRRSYPPPTKLVANLPYNIATPLVVESLDRLPDRRGLVRDGAAGGRRPLLRRARDEGLRRRLGPAAARDRADRVPPGLARGLPPAPERRVRARRVPAHRGRDPDPGVKRLVEAAFAHRRKTLANSLALVGPRLTRERPPRRSSAIGRDAPARAPRSSGPPEFVALAAALG